MIKSNVQLLTDYYLECKNWDYQEPKFYKKNNISYARNCKGAKQILELCDSNLDKSKQMVDKTKEWCEDRGLDWVIETVIRKFLELKNQ
jgi:hypothetical protein